MARQKIEDHLVYVIFQWIPTWAAAAIVAAFYILLRYLLPWLMPGNMWAQLGVAYAPWLTFMLALFALAAQVDKHKRRGLINRQGSLDTLRDMTWQNFELLVGEAYRQQGYRVEETGGSGPDGGVDLILRRNGETVLVQCKRWKTRIVGAPTVRELRGAVARDKAMRGIFVTSGTFTREAVAEAQGQPPLELVDGPALLELIKQVQGQTVPAQPVTASVNQPGINDALASSPVCPRCGAPMLKRTARSGANVGSQFWGCPAFPRCRGTRQI